MSKDNGQREKYADKIKEAIRQRHTCGQKGYGDDLRPCDCGKELRFKLSAAKKLMGPKVTCAFSLPAGPDFSCPGATAECYGCYAQGGHHVRWSVVKLHADNWVRITHLMGKGEEGLDRAANEIARQITTRVFRIHESGDFKWPWQIELWRRIATHRSTSGVQFWTYTRSFALDFKPLVALPNFRLHASTDRSNLDDGTAVAFVKKHRGKVAHAYGPYITPESYESVDAWRKDLPRVDEKKGERIFVCPPTMDDFRPTGRKFGVNAACWRCKACFPENAEHKLQIVFVAHEEGRRLYPLGTKNLGGLLGGIFDPAPGLLPGCLTNSGDPEQMP